MKKKELKSRIDYLERRLEVLEMTVAIMNKSSPEFGTNRTCPVCKLNFDNSLNHYYCGRLDCPTALKPFC